MPKRPFRFKLLFDENFPPPLLLRRLNAGMFDIKHIIGDFNMRGIPDFQVYDVAKREGRIVVTFNEKDFREFASQSSQSGVIGVSSFLSTDQIDKKLTAMLKRSKKSQIYQALNTISQETGKKQKKQEI